MKEFPKPLTKECHENISEQINKSICIVKGKDKKLEIGLFCKIKYKNEYISSLLINNCEKDLIYENKINVLINNKEKIIELENIIYKNESSNITIIKIKEKEKIRGIKDKIKYIEIDDKLYENQSEINYQNDSIYIIQYNNFKDILISYGVIREINANKIIHYGNINSKYKFSPIFNSSNNKLIGINKNKCKCLNKGIFLKNHINEFIEIYSNTRIKYRYINNINQINILLNIEKEDINKKIYFLDNEYEHNSFIINDHDSLKDLNEFNTELYINEKCFKYKKYFFPEKQGENRITLIIGFKLIDCSYMFAGCDKIIDINFKSFSTDKTTNMKYMFYKCKNLRQINLSSWNTKNVIDMSGMFCDCVSLNKLPDISNWDTGKVTDMSKMFLGCDSLKKLPDISKWNTESVINNNIIFNNSHQLIKENKNIEISDEYKIISENKKFEIIDECKIIPAINKILSNTEIKSELNYLKGLFFYKTTNDDFEIDIIKLFNILIQPKSIRINLRFLESNLPYWFNLLLCYDNLTENLIYSFCIRAINCNTHNLFIIVRPEEFNIYQERLLFKTLNNLLEKRQNKINSCIIVLYINQNSLIVNQLKNLKEKCKFQKEPPLFKLMDNYPFPNLEKTEIEIVTSDSSRTGKTEYIKSQRKNSKYLFNFPLGDIDDNYLTKKVESFNKFIKENFIFVFELYENRNGETLNLIKNFLFQILILKSYKSFEYIWKNNVKIFIEVSSDYKNFYYDFKLLKLFRRHHIKFINDSEFYEINKINMNAFKNIETLNYLLFLKNGKINQLDQAISPKDFDSLIKEYFIYRLPLKNKLPNFGQIGMFLELLNLLINKLNKFPELKPQKLFENITKFQFLIDMREKIVNSYIDFVNKFTAFSYESILENQEIASEYQKNLTYKLSESLKKELIERMNEKRVITYNDIKPEIILFNNIPEANQNEYSEINECSILTTYNEDTQQYKELDEFYSNYLELPTLLNLFEFGGPQFRAELKNICLTPDSMTEEIKNILVERGYEFTIDNFVKMVLIYLRIDAKIPLILLGETGCGKTSLIETLFLFLKDKYILKVLYLYQDLSYEEIYKYFKDLDIFEKNYIKNYAIENKIKNLNEEDEKEKKIVVILEHINYSNSINILSEIFVNHSFLGNKIKSNVYFIATCNPYRLDLSNHDEIRYTNKKRQIIRNYLVYNVNPLPSRLMNYIFDFGYIKDEDEIRYIKKFVETFSSNKFSLKNNINYVKISGIIVSAVYEALKFIRITSEISSVSIREIIRFIIISEFFLYITRKKMEFNNPDYSMIKDQTIFSETNNEDEKKDNLIILKSVNIGLFICFYIRINNSKKREELAKLLENILKFDFLDYPLKLENEFANNLYLDFGIAKNKALLDNLFTLFVCLINKIPVFLCGKTGCSKSLSFSLLFQAMKGEYSKNEFFKKYPSLYSISYQYSSTSSSKEIQTIFKKKEN